MASAEDKTAEDVRLIELDHRRRVMVGYLQMKSAAADWHGVMDAAADLREIEAELRTVGAPTSARADVAKCVELLQIMYDHGQRLLSNDAFVVNFAGQALKALGVKPTASKPE